MFVNSFFQIFYFVAVITSFGPTLLYLIKRLQIKMFYWKVCRISDQIQGYPQRNRLKRRLYGIYSRQKTKFNHGIKEFRVINVSSIVGKPCVMFHLIEMFTFKICIIYTSLTTNILIIWSKNSFNGSYLFPPSNIVFKRLPSSQILKIHSWN